MAEDRLIERYLDALRARLSRRSDRDDLVDEVSDHLSCAMERLQAAGVNRDAAARQALQRIGEPKVVASMLSTVPADGSKVALFFFRQVGLLSAIAALVWCAAGVAVLQAFVFFRGVYWPDSAYYVAATASTVAFTVTIVALVAVNIRATGEVDDPARAIGLLGIVTTSLVLTLTWMAPVWMAALVLMIVWTVVRTWRNGLGTRLVRVATIVVLTSTTIGLFITGFMSDASDNYLVAACFLGTTAILTAYFGDIAVRMAYQAARARAITA